jgi:hypothetical protein
VTGRHQPVCDYRKYAGDTRRGKRDLLAGTGALPAFDRLVLVAWATVHQQPVHEHHDRPGAPVS